MKKKKNKKILKNVWVVLGLIVLILILLSIFNETVADFFRNVFGGIKQTFMTDTSLPGIGAGGGGS